MIVRSNGRTARTVLSVGALTLAGVIFASPVGAMQRSWRQHLKVRRGGMRPGVRVGDCMEKWQ
jgi:hypothetical protein